MWIILYENINNCSNFSVCYYLTGGPLLFKHNFIFIREIVENSSKKTLIALSLPVNEVKCTRKSHTICDINFLTDSLSYWLLFALSRLIRNAGELGRQGGARHVAPPATPGYRGRGRPRAGINRNAKFWFFNQALYKMIGNILK